MAALNVTQATGGGTVSSQTPSASDTLSRAALSPNGVVLVAVVGATPSNITISDGGKTPAGSSAATPSAVTVAANTGRAFFIHPSQVDSVTGNVTITSSSQTGLTYHVLPA